MPTIQPAIMAVDDRHYQRFGLQRGLVRSGKMVFARIQPGGTYECVVF